jgi:hypothetical protein
VLAYCIAEKKSQIRIPTLGVEEAAVRSIDMGTLRCFVSDFGAHVPHEPVPEMVKAFNRVLQQIFAQAAIIPFRFPTIVEGEDVLRNFVESRAGEYSRALDRLRNKVQMDVRISLDKGEEDANTASQSGKNYLELKRDSYQRVQSIVEELQRASGSLAEKWVQRDTATGIRCFALVDRSSLSVFLEHIGRVHTPAEISARVTGPWPPSEFVEAADE